MQPKIQGGDRQERMSRLDGGKIGSKRLKRAVSRHHALLLNTERLFFGGNG
jgi:hypothetical protein